MAKCDRCKLRFAKAALAAFFVLACAVHAAQPLTDAEQLGKRIYQKGVGNKPIIAKLSGSGIDAQGPDFPCIKCHGEDGVGGREGGVKTADISPLSLSHAFSGTRPSGRTHAAYDNKLIARAIGEGKDPAGNTLHALMPRYTMDSQDLAGLLAYLKRLGNEPVPGVSDDAIRVGMLLPSHGALKEVGADVVKLLRAYFDRLNAQGGVFGRKIRFAPVEFNPAITGGAQAAIAALREQDAPFCYLANLGIAEDDSASRLLAEQEVPVIAPLTLAGDSSHDQARNIFYIYASLYDQARVAIDYVADTLTFTQSKIALVYADDVLGRGGAKGTRAQAKARGITIVADERFASGNIARVVEQIKQHRASTVMFFGGGAPAQVLIDEASRQNLKLDFFVPAELVGEGLRELPANSLEHVYFVSAVPNPDQQSPEFAQFTALLDSAGLKQQHLAFQMNTYAGARLIEETLKQSQRALTRGAFLGNLETTYKLKIGVTPELSYNANRRNGSIGSTIFKIDGKTKRVYVASDFCEPK